MNKKYYVFVGQKATTGAPNATTGRYSNYGSIYAFNSRYDRDQFVLEFYDPNPAVFCVPVNRKSARAYCRGMSLADFNDYLDNCFTRFKTAGAWDYE